MSDRPARVLNGGQTPLYIRCAESMLDEGTSVRLDDVNGPRGGRDKRCRIKVVLNGLPSVYVEERHESVQAAMDRALARVEVSLRRMLRH